MVEPENVRRRHAPVQLRGRRDDLGPISLFSLADLLLFDDVPRTGLLALLLGGKAVAASHPVGGMGVRAGLVNLAASGDLVKVPLINIGTAWAFLLRKETDVHRLGLRSDGRNGNRNCRDRCRIQDANAIKNLNIWNGNVPIAWKDIDSSRTDDHGAASHGWHWGTSASSIRFRFRTEPINRAAFVFSEDGHATLQQIEAVAEVALASLASQLSVRTTPASLARIVGELLHLLTGVEGLAIDLTFGEALKVGVALNVARATGVVLTEEGHTIFATRWCFRPHTTRHSTSNLK